LTLAAAAFAAAPASAQVKLSQVYGGGGNTGAPYLSDYIEIYNSGAPQDLTGWSVQYASSTGTTWTVTALPAVLLGTGQYLLVKEADGSTVPAGQSLALPTVDATGAIAMSATDAKIALCSSITALSGGLPTGATAATIVDFVGMGTLANWNESAVLAGSPNNSALNAPPGSNNHAIFRLNCGAQDTNTNNLDWSVGHPAPRNTAPASTG
jgi:hypothetical protein